MSRKITRYLIKANVAEEAFQIFRWWANWLYREGARPLPPTHAPTPRSRHQIYNLCSQLQNLQMGFADNFLHFAIKTHYCVCEELS